MATPSWDRWLAFPRILWISLLSALVLGLCTLGMGFFGDDFGHILILEGFVAVGTPDDLFRFAGDRPEVLQQLIQRGVYPWWTLPELKLAFWRPLSGALASFDHRLFGRNPLGYHVHSLAWYLAMVALYGALMRRYLPGALGGLALLVFAIDDAHLLPTGWIANRNALAAAVPALLGLWLHLEWREHRRRWALPLSLAAFAVGLTGGETALGLFAYVGAYELLGARGTWAERLRGLVPPAALGIGYLLLYKARGYGAYGSGSYLDPIVETGSFLFAALLRLPALLGGQFLGLPLEIWPLGPSVHRVLAGLGLVGVGLFVWILRAAWPGLSEEERRHCRWLFAGAALSLVPVLAVFPSNRLLLVPSVGGALAIAVALRHAWRPLARAVPSRGMRAAGWGLALIHLVLAALFWPLMAQGVAQLGASARTMLQVTESELELERLSEQYVMVLTPGDPVRGMYTAALWAFHGKPVPRAWRTLSLSPEGHVFTRTGPASFELELTQGRFHTSEFEAIFRAPRYRLTAGAQVELEHMRATVLAADEQGPTRLGFEFDAPLESPSFVFLHWRDGGLRRFEPPAVGTRVGL
jgi:hypothetical protein